MTIYRGTLWRSSTADGEVQFGIPWYADRTDLVSVETRQRRKLLYKQQDTLIVIHQGFVTIRTTDIIDCIGFNSSNRWTYFSILYLQKNPLSGKIFCKADITHHLANRSVT